MIQDRPLYVVEGKEIGVGGDGEPVLANCLIVMYGDPDRRDVPFVVVREQLPNESRVLRMNHKHSCVADGCGVVNEPAWDHSRALSSAARIPDDTFHLPKARATSHSMVGIRTEIRTVSSPNSDVLPRLAFGFGLVIAPPVGYPYIRILSYTEWKVINIGSPSGRWCPTRW